MPDVTESYEMALDFIWDFAQNWRLFMSKVHYLHKTFIKCKMLLD